MTTAARRPPRHATPERQAARRALGERLASARGYRRMTQADVGEHLGVSALTIRKWETGEREPDALDAVKLAALFRVRIDTLLGGGELVFES